MLIGESYKIVVPSKYHKKGWTTSIVCVRKCDNCGSEDEIKYRSLISQRKNRGKDIDACNKCCNLRRFRTLPRGKDTKQFKHGLMNTGYRRITTVDGRRMLEHRYIMEKHIGRLLDVKECVHHIDGDKINNDLDNLFLCKSKADHINISVNIRQFGISLLNKSIWFDYDNKIYVSKYVKPRIINLQLDFKPKLYTKKNPRVKIGGLYQFYLIRKSSNKWMWKRWHVYVAEQIIQRELKRNECVHHIDNNGLNNDFSNLCVMANSEHTTCHHSLEKIIINLYRQGKVKFDRDTMLYSFK